MKRLRRIILCSLQAVCLVAPDLASAHRAAIGFWKPSSARMVQHTSGFLAANSMSLAFSSNITAGNTLVACVSNQSNSGTTTISDNKSNTWVLAASRYTGFGSHCYYALNAAGGATTVTTGGGAGFIVLMLAEINGVAALDVADSNFGTSSAPSAGTPGPVSNSNDYVLGYAADWSSYSTWTAGSGYTVKELADQNGATGTYIAALEEKNSQTGLTGTQTPNFNKSTSDGWNAIVLAFSPQPFNAAPAVVQHTSNYAAAASVNATYPSNPKPGNLLIACANSLFSAGSVTLSDNAGQNWQDSNIHTGNMRCWYAPYAKSASTTVTVSSAGSPFVNLTLVEVSGHFEVLDQTGQNSGTNNSPTASTAGSVTSSTEYVFSYILHWTSGNDTFTAGTGYTIRDLGHPGSGSSSDTAFEDANTYTGLSGVQTATFTSTGSNWNQYTRP